MKKTLLFLAIIAMFFTIACEKTDPTPIDNPTPSVTLDTVTPPVVDTTIVVPEAQKVTILGDNLHYNETQISVEQRYSVVLGSKEQEANATKAISWSVNGEIKGNGATFNFTPQTAGEYKIKYAVEKPYSTTNALVSVEVMVKAYSSSGVYILNEPNFNSTEKFRGIHKHTFGSKTVDKFNSGDFTSFGKANQYIANWAGKIYTIASNVGSGVAFSQFMATDGTFVKAIASLPAKVLGNAFAGITPEMGVLSTASGAYIVNLADLTLSSVIMKGSEGSTNLFMADGYLFMITTGGAKAYKLKELSTTTEPTVLGVAKTGFVQSKDGNVWAADGGNLLSINPKDLTIQKVVLPESVAITFSAEFPWRQCSWVASSADNTFFFTKDTWGMSEEVYKYDITSKVLTTKFIDKTDDLSNHSLYSTSLLYDAQRDELICQTIRSYAEADYNGLHLFSAKTGVKSYEVIYDTTDDNIYDIKDMWFPAMTTLIKGY